MITASVQEGKTHSCRCTIVVSSEVTGAKTRSDFIAVLCATPRSGRYQDRRCKHEQSTYVKLVPVLFPQRPATHTLNVFTDKWSTDLLLRLVLVTVDLLRPTISQGHVAPRKQSIKMIVVDESEPVGGQ